MSRTETLDSNAKMAKGTRMARKRSGAPAQKCPICKQPITWMPTNINGVRMCFEAKPVPREYDRDREGWLPGVFTVDGVPRMVLAPSHEHPDDKAQRAQYVLMPHLCPPKAKENDEHRETH